MSRRRPLPLPVEQMPSALVLEGRRPPLDWSEVFGRRAEVELEIGCGKGLFLVSAAQRHPEVDFVGIERATKYFLRAVERVWRERVPNARVVEADAFEVLRTWVPPGSVRAVHVYFPDPWPKKRHSKRRLLQGELYRGIARALAPGGTFCFASDVAQYFAEATEELGRFPAFARVPWPEDDPARVSTSYARKYEAEGRPMQYARYARTPQPAPPDPLPTPAPHALSGTRGETGAAAPAGVRVGGRVARPAVRRRSLAPAEENRS